MKKLLLVCALAVAGVGQTYAQLDTEDYGIFNHFGVGVGLGTNGITLDASTVVTPYVGIRAGVNIFPNVKITTDLGLGQIGDNAAASIAGLALPQGDYAFEAKTKMTTGHVLVDLFPFTSSSFRFTVGAYFGSSKIISMNNEKDGALLDVYQYNTRTGPYAGLPVSDDRIGVKLGDYFLEPDAKGNVQGGIKVNSFRPYVGLGFGRSVPKKRIGLQFDLGVQFWGTPKVFVKGLNGEETLTEKDAKGNGDAGDAIKTLSKISVYPNLSLRLVGRIF